MMIRKEREGLEKRGKRKGEKDAKEEGKLME
jgi:hypothetical protein